MSPASNKDELLAELKGHHLPASLLDAVSYKLRQLEYAEQKVQLLEERLRLQQSARHAQVAPRACQRVAHQSLRVDGIAPSGDPLTEVRADIYLLSGRRRRAASG